MEMRLLVYQTVGAATYAPLEKDSLYFVIRGNWSALRRGVRFIIVQNARTYSLVSFRILLGWDAHEQNKVFVLCWIVREFTTPTDGPTL